MEKLKNIENKFNASMAELEIATQHEYLKSLNQIIEGLKGGNLGFRDWLTMRGAEVEREITMRHINGLKDRLKLALKEAVSK
jgi:hypothetical protein